MTGVSDVRVQLPEWRYRHCTFNRTSQIFSSETPINAGNVATWDCRVYPVWTSCSWLKHLFIYVCIYLLKAYSPVNPHRVTSELLTKSNLTEVEYNKKHAHFTNVRHIYKHKAKVSPFGIALIKKMANKVRCWYHWPFRSGVSILDYIFDKKTIDKNNLKLKTTI